MKRQIFIKKLESLKIVAHRLGYKMTNYPENSIDVLYAIFNNEGMLNSCDGFEFDICFTKDHIPVVIHDKYIDDISDGNGLIKEYFLEELKKFNFGYRKSLNVNSSKDYKIVTLEEVLDFFTNNKNLLGKKIIKIETKDILNSNNKNLVVLADIFDKYTDIRSNIIHLSYYPQNLINLKKIQKAKGYTLTKSDLLIDDKITYYVSRLFKSLDGISLRIITTSLPKPSKNNSKRVNKKIKSDLFFIKYAKKLDEKTLEYIINKYGSIGLYTLNDEVEIDNFCKYISEEFFNKYSDKIIFTSDNPLKLKQLNHK